MSHRCIIYLLWSYSAGIQYQRSNLWSTGSLVPHFSHFHTCFSQLSATHWFCIMIILMVVQLKISLNQLTWQPLNLMSYFDDKLQINFVSKKHYQQEWHKKYHGTIFIVIIYHCFTIVICLVDLGVRLVHGEGPHEGEVQVFYNGTWGYICNENQHWDGNAARAVCRELGFINEQG